MSPSPPLTAQNGLARCVCHARYRRVQSLSRRYATSAPQYHIGARNFAQLRHKVTVGDNGMPRIYSQNYPFPSTISTLPTSNTTIPRLTALNTPNGTQIQSAVFQQFTHRTDRCESSDCGAVWELWTVDSVVCGRRLSLVGRHDRLSEPRHSPVTTV